MLRTLLDAIEEKYKCDCKDAKHNSGNCFDCLNQGYVFNSEEVALLQAYDKENKKLHTLIEEARPWVQSYQAYREGLDLTSNCTTWKKIEAWLKNTLNS